MPGPKVIAPPVGVVSVELALSLELDVLDADALVPKIDDGSVALVWLVASVEFELLAVT
jgi:hypothetical protein